jgi:hypothetical protein
VTHHFRNAIVRTLGGGPGYPDDDAEGAAILAMDEMQAIRRALWHFAAAVADECEISLLRALQDKELPASVIAWVLEVSR